MFLGLYGPQDVIHTFKTAFRRKKTLYPGGMCANMTKHLTICFHDISHLMKQTPDRSLFSHKSSKNFAHVNLFIHKFMPGGGPVPHCPKL